MGEEAAKQHEQPSGSTEPKTEGQGKTAERKTDKRASTADQNPAPTAAPGIGEIRVLTGGAAEKDKSPSLVSGVTPAPAAPPTQGKRKAPEAPKGSKSSPAKAQAAALAEAATQQTADMLAALIKTISAVCSIRPGMEVWRMTEGECKAIATPAANIMAKHSLTDKASEYADYIALVTAVGVAVVPRVLISMNQKPRGEVKNNVQPIRKPAQPAATQNSETRKSDSHRAEYDGGATSSGISPTKQLLAGIVGEYG